MIRPIGNNILIKIHKIENKTGIVLPDEVSERLIQEKAEVLAIGEKVKCVSVGQYVLFKSWAIDCVKIGKEEHIFLKDEFILAIL